MPQNPPQKIYDKLHIKLKGAQSLRLFVAEMVPSLPALSLGTTHIILYCCLSVVLVMTTDACKCVYQSEPKATGAGPPAGTTKDSTCSCCRPREVSAGLKNKTYNQEAGAGLYEEVIMRSNIYKNFLGVRKHWPYEKKLLNLTSELLLSKDVTKRVIRQTTDHEVICAMQVSDKEIISKIHKELL